MNTGNVVKSLLLGLAVGVLVLLLDPGIGGIGERLLAVLVSGGIGLLVGVVTEWITSLLPARIARAGVYFLLNGAIAAVVTAAVLTALFALTGYGADDTGWVPILLVIVGAVCLANLGDYLRYRRARVRLRAVQAGLSELSSGGDEA
ncbi:hypothetical protein [Leucobacter chironomi]|uniref:hypothetical protein n=1 Tax=Leucobacter chironomi TaxID=491918 RepID=UPI00040726A7|nr:hypothetical protein [Leucobacter chironomi]